MEFKVRFVRVRYDLQTVQSQGRIMDQDPLSRVLHSTIGACRLTATATATVVILGGPSSGLSLHTGGLAYRGSHPSDV
ncbi:hypothetical protein N7504_006543 [Penicillium tannophilum]|nr:hypothetical protein N7504_006543 [Penicillium tannophilum]